MAERPLDPTIGWVAKHLREYVESGGENGHMWRGVPTLVLTHRGRRSGALRRTPLIYGRAGDAYVVVASYGGRPEDPFWYRNLRAYPDVTIQVKGEVMPATARTAEGAERDELWRTMAAIFPAYDEYRGRTSRVIPVVVLEPVAGG